MMANDLLELPQDRAYSDAELEELLSVKVTELLETQRDWLLGKLYRLDVREGDIKAVLAGDSADIPKGLARLIVARHRQRIEARRRHADSAEATHLKQDTEYGDLSW